MSHRPRVPAHGRPAVLLAAICLVGVFLSRRGTCKSACATVPPPSSTGPSPSEWREFRAKLVSQGIKLTTDVDSGKVAAERTVVAPENEKLLQSQNEALYQEYISGAWAHSSLVEPGGLLCRMPTPMELVHQMREGGAEAGAAGVLRKRLEDELPQIEGRSPEELYESWSMNTDYCYRLAEAVIADMINNVAAKADDQNRLEITALDPPDRELLYMYADERQCWQSVCLVLSSPGDSTTIASEAVTLNRPLLRPNQPIDADFVRSILNGAKATAGVVDNSGEGKSQVFSDEVVSRFVEAFGKERGLYAGGPVDVDAPAVLVHGFDLPGSKEIAPGTKIYTGGVEAAIDGVLDGTYQPLDFRWFLGKHKDLKADGGKWLPVACARPIALKQCLSLPKPLWHEVLELCGGEPAKVSRMEFEKRPED